MKLPVLSRWLHLPRPRRTVYQVGDGANWVLDWVARYIAAELRQQGVSAAVTDDPWRLKRQIIHFVDRYTYFRSGADLHSSNIVFLNWYHGEPNDPAMQTQFESLCRALPSLRQVVVSCTMTHNQLVAAGIEESKLSLIPLGVDLTRFSPVSDTIRREIRTRLGIPPDALCIGSFQKDGVGWDEGNEPKLIKGPDVFLEVIGRLASHYSNLWVLLTGPARGYVKHGLEQLGISYVHHLINNYHDIVEYYRALDLYIIPARAEGGPQALLESWATGVPVVSTRVGMPADLIEHGKNGMLAEVEDSGALVQHTMTLLEDAEWRKRCILQGMEDVKRYSWPVIAERHLQQLYIPFLA